MVSEHSQGWSYPSTLHALTVINISNQSPCCLNTCKPCFRWTGEMQNWALTQAPGTSEARPQIPKRPRGAQKQPNPDTQKQMLLILSRLALKHDLEIRELQAATFRTMLVKHDQPLLQASKAAPVQKNISEGLGQVAVFRGPPDSAHLVPHHQSHESEGRQRDVRPGSSGGQRARTPTNARQSITQAGDKKGGQQSLTSWLRPEMPSTVRSSTEDSRGGQRLLTSWMRPKSSPAPAVYAAQAAVVEYISPDPAVTHNASAPVVTCISPARVVRYASPAPEVRAAPAPVVENISPAPAVSYAETVPVMEYTSPAPAGCSVPAALVEYVSPALTVSIAEQAPTVYAHMLQLWSTSLGRQR